MKWRTSVSTHNDGNLYLRGKPLVDMVADGCTFTEMIFLTVKGVAPKEKETKMLDAALSVMVEHGVEVPSAFVARSVASTGNNMNTSLAAGVLAIGDWHGGAIEEAARLLQSEDSPGKIVSDALKNKKRISGFGHRIYKDGDPRAAVLFKIARNLKFNGKFISRAEEMEKELFHQTGKTLPINIDGAVAAIISELGFDWRLGKAFFILGRLPGLIAHVDEEIRNEKPYRRFEESDVEYIGPSIK